MASHPSIGFVSFTGSVQGGRGVEAAVVNGFDRVVQTNVEATGGNVSTKEKARVGFAGVGLEVRSLSSFAEL